MEPQTEVREPRERPETNGHGQEARIEAGQRTELPLARLLRELVQETHALARGEAQLMRAEVSEKVAQAERGIASMVSGAAVIFSGSVVLLTAIAIALSAAMQAWVAFLIVGAAATLIGGAMAAAGKKKVEVQNLKPQRSIDEAKADGRFVKEMLS